MWTSRSSSTSPIVDSTVADRPGNNRWAVRIEVDANIENVVHENRSHPDLDILGIKYPSAGRSRAPASKVSSLTAELTVEGTRHAPKWHQRRRDAAFRTNVLRMDDASQSHLSSPAEQDNMMTPILEDSWDQLGW